VASSLPKTIIERSHLASRLRLESALPGALVADRIREYSVRLLSGTRRWHVTLASPCWVGASKLRAREAQVAWTR